jgi:hypothetical protein
LDGVTSGITLPELTKFPSGGYSVCVWLNLHVIGDARKMHYPRLFSFLNAGECAQYASLMRCVEGAGIEAYFVGPRLSLRVRHGANGSKIEDAQCGYVFEASRWYHVVITHQ